MSDEEILKKYGIEIKRGIDEIVGDYKVTDPGRILVDQNIKKVLLLALTKSKASYFFALLLLWH